MVEGATGHFNYAPSFVIYVVSMLPRHDLAIKTTDAVETCLR
jgi:hypothetical protein